MNDLEKYFKQKVLYKNEWVNSVIRFSQYCNRMSYVIIMHRFLQNDFIFTKSGEAYSSSAGEQLDRNNLIR